MRLTRVCSISALAMVLSAALPALAASPRAAKAAPRPTAVTKRAVLMFQTTTPATVHSVELSWVASADASTGNPVTYEVLRAPGACGASGQTFAVLAGATGITATTYTDSGATDATLLGGETYCYEVEAVGQNGAVSAPSNTAAGAVPPFPPTGAKTVAVE